MMKRYGLSAVSLLLMVGLCACSQNNEQSSAASAPSSSPEIVSSAAQSAPPSSESSAVEEETASLDHILMAIEAAYAENYPPDGEIPAEVLETEFGLTPDLYTEVKGEMAMISVQNDRVVVAKAAPGKADELEKALNDARERKIQDTMQYPANIAKTNAAKVVRHGDYVAFLLVGVLDDSMEDVESDQAKQHAEEQVQKAVDAFYSVFQS